MLTRKPREFATLTYQPGYYFIPVWLVFASTVEKQQDCTAHSVEHACEVEEENRHMFALVHIDANGIMILKDTIRDCNAPADSRPRKFVEGTTFTVSASLTRRFDVLPVNPKKNNVARPIYFVCALHVAFCNVVDTVGARFDSIVNLLGLRVRECPRCPLPGKDETNQERMLRLFKSYWEQMSTKTKQQLVAFLVYDTSPYFGSALFAPTTPPYAYILCVQQRNSRCVTCKILQVFVYKDHERQGIASLLVRLARSLTYHTAYTAGNPAGNPSPCAHVAVEMPACLNEATLPFWQRNGFEVREPPRGMPSQRITCIYNLAQGKPQLEMPELVEAYCMNCNIAIGSFDAIKLEPVKRHTPSKQRSKRTRQ